MNNFFVKILTRTGAIPGALGAFSLAVLLPGAGSPSQLTKGDVYTFVFMTSVGMLETGNYLVPVWNSKMDFSKPPLFHWLLVGALRLFGNPFFAVQVIPILCSCLSVLLTYALGRLLDLPKSRSAFAGLIFLSCAAMSDYGRQPLLEAPLLAVLLTGAYGLTRACLRNEPGWLLLFGVALGSSSMIKWVVGPLVLIGYACCYLSVSGHWRLLARKPIYATGALALAAAIALPWPLYILTQHYPDVANYMYHQLYVERFSEYIPLSRFLGYVALGFAPWSLLLIPTFAGRARLPKDAVTMLGSWIAAILIPILIISNRSARYAYPVLPALALWIAAAAAPTSLWRLSLRAAGILAWTCLTLVLLAVFRLDLLPVWLFLVGIAAACAALMGFWRASVNSLLIGVGACAVGLSLLVGPGTKAVGFHVIPARVLQIIGPREVRRFENLPEAASTGYLPIYLMRRVFIVDDGDLWGWGTTSKSMLLALSGSSLGRLQAVASSRGFKWRILEQWQSPHTHPRWEQLQKVFKTRSLSPIQVTHYLVELTR